MWILILLIWEGAYRLIRWPASAFPAPSHVVAALWEMGKTAGLELRLSHGNVLVIGELPISLGISLLRLVVGSAASLAGGAALAIAMRRWRTLDNMLSPLFLGLQALPSVCWVPVALLIPSLGSSERGILFVLIMGSMFAIAISLRDGLAGIPQVYPLAGRMLGAHGWKLWWDVMLPASLPALATTLRLGFSFAWRSLMGAEVLFTAFGATSGLGILLANQRKDVPRVVAVMAIMIAIAMAADVLVFARLQRRVAARFGISS